MALIVLYTGTVKLLDLLYSFWHVYSPSNAVNAHTASMHILHKCSIHR